MECETANAKQFQCCFKNVFDNKSKYFSSSIINEKRGWKRPIEEQGKKWTKISRIDPYTFVENISDSKRIASKFGEVKNESNSNEIKSSSKLFQILSNEKYTVDNNSNKCVLKSTLPNSNKNCANTNNENTNSSLLKLVHSANSKIESNISSPKKNKKHQQDYVRNDPNVLSEKNNEHGTNRENTTLTDHKGKIYFYTYI